MPAGYFLTEGYRAQIDDLIRRFGAGVPQRVPGQSTETPNYDLIQFKCNAACPAYGVMRITGVTLDDDNWPTLTTVQPDTTFAPRYLVNLGEDAASDGSGNYYGTGTYLDFSGHVLCDSTYTPTAGQEWGPTSGSWSLVRHRPGFLIDGGPTGSGATYRAVAKQRVVTLLHGRLAGTLSEGGIATMNIMFRNAASGAREEVGMSVTVYDFFLGSGDSWPTDTRVMASFESGIWTVDQAACSPDTGGGGGGGGGGSSSQSPATLSSGSDMEANFYPGGIALGSADTSLGTLKEYDSVFGL